jgi:hypothetical protein
MERKSDIMVSKEVLASMEKDCKQNGIMIAKVVPVGKYMKITLQKID